MSNKTGWSRGRGLRDTYEYLMDLAADIENRADELDAAMVSVEAEIGVAAFEDDARLRAASWSETLRTHARRLRDEATATRPATTSAKSGV